MDSTTAKLLLESISSGAGGSAADLYKAISENGTAGPSEEDIAWFLENKDKRVSILGTDNVGYISGLNTNTHGLYDGASYPIYITLDGGIGKGCTFEYSRNFIILD